ncbi:fumarylacetoacetate hydrolase family protein [Pseudonocardia xishanensis]|uniref:fumarylacetoacetate hydrolase family protein n=1 Tax=Pseudonocardia xishanensis TaxID=630995 RepID=UPI003CD0578D
MGFHYADHTVELAVDPPTRLRVFPKLVSCVGGPSDVVDLPGGHVDWEVELVVLIGRYARHVAAAARRPGRTRHPLHPQRRARAGVPHEQPGHRLP